MALAFNKECQCLFPVVSVNAEGTDKNILKELNKSEDVITVSINPNLSKKLRSIIPSLNSD